MKKALLILLCVLAFCLSGCESWQQTEAAQPSESVLETPAKESWQPYYTGEERDWELEYPWAFLDTQEHSNDQEQGLDAYFALGGAMAQDDYGGCFINNSGTLTVLITDPTIERAEFYAGLCDVGFWIVEAEYTLDELEDAKDDTAELIRSWLDENPDVSLRLNGWGIRETENRVYINLSGSDRAILERELTLPGCVYLNVSETADSSDAAEIPWEPVYQWSSGAISVYLDQAEFPVGVKNINITLENRSDGSLAYGESYTFEKYVGGIWVDASGNIAFTAVGHGLEEYDKETFYINTEFFPEPLGVGLYRIIGSELRYCERGNDTSYGQDYENLGNYVLEFSVTEDAEPAPEPVDTIYSPIAEKEDWQWFGIWDIVDEQIGIPTYSKTIQGPYFAHIVGNGNYIHDEPTTEFRLDVYDRSTGNKLTGESIAFSGDYDSNTITDRSGNLFIRTDETVYRVSVVDGEVNIMQDAQFPDEDIPYPPESSDTALDGSLSIQMEQEYYPEDAKSIAVLLTNNTDEEMTIEYKRSDYGIYKLEAVHSWFYNCWYSDPEAVMPEDQLFMEPNTLTIAPGGTCRFEESLEHWSYDSDDSVKPLGRGLYQMIFSQITVNTGDISEKVSFTVEFGIE